MKIFRNRKSESGQAMLEFAMVFPIFILMVMLVIDLSWIGFHHMAFDYSFRVSSWEISVGDIDKNIDHEYLVTGNQAKKRIMKQFMKNAVLIKESDIKIENPYIKLTKEEDKVTLPDKQKVHKRRYMDMHADIVYEFSLPTPIGRSVFGKKFKIVKTLDKYRLIQLKS